GFNLYTALEACSEHLERFGGHASAAGLGINAKNEKCTEDNVVLFRDAFCEYAQNEITDEMRTAEILIDAESPLGIFTLKLVSQIEGLAPFGCANRRPIFCARGVYLSDQPKKMGAEDRHFSAVFEQDGISFRTVSFGNGSWVDKMEQHGAGPFDIAFHVVTNHFGGKSKVELQLIDWKSTSSPNQ
ncbi:MAG: single-stranded-DNA-specific exonuclease RecJ, partial [Thermoguttaceae bacterium]